MADHATFKYLSFFELDSGRFQQKFRVYIEIVQRKNEVNEVQYDHYGHIVNLNEYLNIYYGNKNLLIPMLKKYMLHVQIEY